MTGRWTGAAGPDLRDLLETLDPKARDDLRRVLIRDQADRDAISRNCSATAANEATAGPTSSTC
jgi:hypothetical protein